MNLPLILPALIHSVLTLYMLLILVRWFGPYIQLDFYDARLRWIAALVDPFLRSIRSLAPALGPVDLAPLLALLALWVVRTIAVNAAGGAV